jgi:hypothetical protein
MKDAELRREFHRVCRKSHGRLNDDEKTFRAFKAGVDYASGNYGSDLLDQLIEAVGHQEE